MLRLRKQRGLLLVHALGSGKTLTAVAAAADYLRTHPGRKAIVITPKSLQSNFLKELVRWDDSIPQESFELYTFESFLRRAEGERKCVGAMLIVDEAHNLRTQVSDTSGSRAKAVLDCAASADRVLLLTATPFVNDPYDICNLIQMLGGQPPISKTQFLNILTNKSKFNKYFKNKISFYFPNKSTIKKYYPETVIHEIFLKMPAEYKKEYEKVERSIGYQHIFSNPSVFFNGIRRASNALDNSVKSPKLQWLFAMLRTNSNKKTLIYSNWLVHGLGLVRELLERLGVPYAHVDGSLSKKRRQEAVERYNEGTVRVLMISRAGGEGLDLHGTNNIVVLEPNWNLAATAQVVGRGVRYRSHEHLAPADRTVHVYHLHLVKPHEKDSKYYADLRNARADRRTWSVDMYLRALGLFKQAIIIKIIKDIKKIN